MVLLKKTAKQTRRKTLIEKIDFKNKEIAAAKGKKR